MDRGYNKNFFKSLHTLLRRGRELLRKFPDVITCANLFLPVLGLVVLGPACQSVAALQLVVVAVCQLHNKDNINCILYPRPFRW